MKKNDQSFYCLDRTHLYFIENLNDSEKVSKSIE